MFIHGLWLLPSSWDRWAALFDEAGYAPASPGWPDDPGTVAEASAKPRGLLSALKAGFPVLGNPANRHRAVPLTYDQFRYAFGNAVPEDEAEARVDTGNPDRGHSLIIDRGWREVAQTALAFVRRFTQQETRPPRSG